MAASSKALLLIVAVGALIAGIVFSQTEHKTIKPSALPYLETTYPTNIANQSSSIKKLHKSLTIINFWATWCGPCREEMPLLEQHYRLYEKDGLTIIGMAIDTPDRAQPFLDSMDITYPILYVDDVGMQLLADSGNPAGLLPYTLVLNETGEITHKKLGLISSADIKNWLDQLVQ